jgi:predicted Zn-dependent protease
MATVVGPPGSVGLSLVAVVLKDGRAHIFRGETREPKAAEALRAGMRYIIDHLRTITYADLKLANTERIELYEAQPGDTYESLARGSPIQANVANELRLLNGDYPNGQPRAGDRIKIVR